MIEELSLVLPRTEAAASEIDVAELVATYSSVLFRVAHSVLRSPEEAEDVVQDAFVRVLQHRRALPDVRDRRVWLIRIAWNLALDRRRRIRPEQMDDAFLHRLRIRDVPADLAMEEAQQMEAVFRAMDHLPGPERQALLMSTVRELETAEVAAVMGKSESAVRALLFRARARLRERLGKGGNR